jgi:predicted nucleic acid-binding protein
MPDADPIMVDTNILVYALNSDSPQYEVAYALLGRAKDGQFQIALSPQIVGELYATLTNSKKISKFLSPKEAADTVEGLWKSEAVKQVFPKKDTLQSTLELVKHHGLVGPDFFDAQIVATMLDNDITRIYTINYADFQCFEGIEVMNPLGKDSF